MVQELRDSIREHLLHTSRLITASTKMPDQTIEFQRQS